MDTEEARWWREWECLELLGSWDCLPREEPEEQVRCKLHLEWSLQERRRDWPGQCKRQDLSSVLAQHSRCFEVAGYMNLLGR